ncbi:MAG: winged helix-turn-helix domain-containing protein [Bacilli bacterium]
MTQDDIKYEVATLLTVQRCSYNEIARRLGLTESRVGAIIRDLRRMGILPPATHRTKLMVSRLALPVEPAELQEAIGTVELAVNRYAALMENSPSQVLSFLSTRETVELGTQLLGLSGPDGQDMPAAVVHALAHVLERGGYDIPPLSGFTPVR